MIRDLFGMSYKSVELEHNIMWPIDRILREIAYYFEDENIRYGMISSLTTQSHPEDMEKSITTLVWAVG